MSMKKPHVVILSPVYPFPPSDGVRLPLFSYLNFLIGLGKYSVTLVVSSCGCVDVPEGYPGLSDGVRVVYAKYERPSMLRLFLEESFLGRAAFANRRYDNLDSVLSGLEPDVILATPISEVGLAAEIERSSGRSGITLALIHDAWAGSLRLMSWQRMLKSHGLVVRMTYFLRWLRGIAGARVERKALWNASKVFVQTDTDRKLLLDSLGADSSGRVLLLPNGVNEHLFSLEEGDGTARVLFVGRMTGEYASVMRWFLDKVWPLVLDACPLAQLRVVGRCMDESLRARMEAEPSVIHEEYVEDVTDVYRGMTLSIAPIFKGYGLINKVLESMAAGVPVVGDATAFTFLNGFEAGRHGLVADTAEGMAKAIGELLCNSKRRKSVAQEGRELAARYSWIESSKVLLREMEALLRSPRN